MTNTRASAGLVLVTILVCANAHGNMTKGQRSAYSETPIYFEKNFGQSARQVRFIALGGQVALFLTDKEAVLVLEKDAGRTSKTNSPSTAVRLKLSGANERPVIHGEGLLKSKSNYFIGNDPSTWRTDVARYERVRMTEVYRGIDAVYYGNGKQFEYDFVVKAGADPGQIRLSYEGVERIEIDATGDLVLHMQSGELRQRSPVVYQEIGGRRTHVRARYRRISPHEFGFQIAPYDEGRPLVIDPVLVYSTYLGGSSDDVANGVAVDSAGNAYVTGYTRSVDFPTTANAFRTTKPIGTIAAFVTKLSPSGSPVYSTYLGGGSHTEAHAIAVDSAGSAYVTGNTFGGDFPIVNAAQSAFGGLKDAFVVKLSPSGSAITYSTYVGGQTGDAGYGIAVDNSGSAVVTGDTSSADFPTVNALQAFLLGVTNAFVAKLNPSGSAFVYLTLLGGSRFDRGLSAAVDAAGNAYVTGFTNSTNFPTANAVQSSFGGVEDAFVTKINSSGSALVYSTYLGGSTLDDARGIAVDSSGNAVVTGLTLSTNFPTANALQASSGGSTDAFVTKLNSSGSALLFSTFLGGSAQDGSRAVTVDASGNVYVAGTTLSPDFPRANPVQPSYGGGTTEAFAAALNSAGSTLIYSTFLGGSGFDEASGVGVSGSGTAVVTGSTYSTNFPTANAFQSTFQGGPSDAFVSTMAFSDMTISKTHSGNFLQGQTGATYTIAVTNNGAGASSGSVVVTDTLPNGLTATNIAGSGWTCTLGGPGLRCTRSDALAAGSSYPPITLTVDVSPATVGTVTNTATVSGGGETNSVNNSTTDVTTVSMNPAIPMLDLHSLAALAVMLAAMGVVVLRR